ncbi:alpha/beta fold hydrolase [Paracraurococcus lichenis]|uniref:Alpha/beta hydrolase n=1 Tax=Paracraurococcus lichenis TaxID=3064888 RepID=A0ABT9E4G7_9PROT|nr:alpha/beta hydrolase [Paracraurococcus sp. LOR1-02]MDO9711052.1 alpha/beta hydrolase [Paracraurococcus sp. LOR1-02]
MEIRHQTILTNGIRMHVAEAGEGPAVLLCHGFPEAWHSWRHQMQALAEAGYRAIAPDMRGYGETAAPAAIADYTLLHLVGDMVGLLDALSIDRAVIAGHDWGAPVAWNAALMRPDRFRAVAGLSVPYAPRGPVSAFEMLRRAGRHRFYQLYFQAPGVAEEELQRDPASTLRRTFWSLSGDAPEGQRWSPDLPEAGFLASLHEPSALPAWLPDAELALYAETYRRTGFRGGLNWYRNIERNWELLAPFAGAPMPVPGLFIAGRRDPVLGWSGRALEALPRAVPDLRGTVLVETAGHWVQQEAAAEVNRALLGFLQSL